MRARFTCNTLSAALIAGISLAGCFSAGHRPEPLTAGPDEMEHRPAPGTAQNGPTLFGEEPEQEQLPFESRLITNLRQHTFTMEGLDFDPDLAPDGETLVFASTRNSERPDIFLKKPDGTAVTQLTGDPADDIQPRFSPGGEQVAFCSNRSGNWDIWLINRDGTGLTQLTADRSDEIAPCWSPDGMLIAYTVWGYRSHRWEIWTLDVLQPGVRSFLAYGMFPAWSPDGSRVAFQRARQRGSHWFSVWIVELVDGEARHPTEIAHSSEAACIAPCWSPDGRIIVYSAVEPSGGANESGVGAAGQADLWAVELESGLRMKLTDGATGAFNPVWGPDDRVFFVSARAGTENIWSVATELGDYPQVKWRTHRISRGPSENTKRTAGE